MNREVEKEPVGRIDPADLLRRLGLQRADERPIIEALRRANTEWLRRRRERIAAHAQRVRLVSIRRLTPGRRRAVWCVELCRAFGSLSEAARFVNRKPSHISQSLQRGVTQG